LQPHETSRIACLLVPNLLVSAERRAHPELRDRPLAIASGEGAEILAVSPEAERAGVRALHTVVQARSICAGLRVRTASLALERAARATLRDVALSVSPRVEQAPPGSGAHVAEAAVFLDASGIQRLFASETGFAGALLQRAERLSLPARVTVAGSRGVAQLAARSLVLEEEAVRVIPPGTDATFLAPLPLDLLAPDDALVEALSRLGIRRLGQLARLPGPGLATRLGPGALALQALARGLESGPPVSPVRDTKLEEAIDLECPVDRIEPLSFVLRGLLSRLLERLDVRGLACRDLELSLSLLAGGSHDRYLSLAAPTLDARTVLRRVLLALEEDPPGAAVDRVAIALHGHTPRRDQLDLFRPAGPAPARLESLLAELEVLCGQGRVGTPKVADDWQPGAYGMAPFATSLDPAAPPSSPTSTTLAMRALRPALLAQVHARNGRPEQIRSALANGRVVRAAGPWRTTGAWWSSKRRFAYDHFDVQTEDGLVTRLRYDWVSSRWEIDGVYD